MTAPGLLLIRGLGHSGSTVLDLALGAHPQMLGLGEAIRILRAPALHEERRGPARLRGDGRFERRCTCGCLAAECPVWGPVLTWLPEHDQSSMPEKLNQLLISVERSALGPARSFRPLARRTSECAQERTSRTSRSTRTGRGASATARGRAKSASA